MVFLLKLYLGCKYIYSDNSKVICRIVMINCLKWNVQTKINHHHHQSFRSAQKFQLFLNLIFEGWCHNLFKPVNCLYSSFCLLPRLILLGKMLNLCCFSSLKKKKNYRFNAVNSQNSLAYEPMLYIQDGLCSAHI